MAYELVQSGRTQFAIDWSVVRRLVRSHYLTYHQLNYAQGVTLADSHWYNPLSWSLPDVSNIEVDWDTVKPPSNAKEIEPWIRAENRQVVLDRLG